ncbi:hypothetical protein TWF225_003296 [Orbilia oligospora]|nr:hypothetical protein TWF225_003296 [Orbilia oligospora]KAF3238047.1 hypothetical protein TWF128_000718 [Orbilia oligospora]KAF3267304.1 hypothetical protein TWF217_000375 [Orbilia oligospora]KAF3294321.1 hypothetical protein TWF132_003317 [Orbilia oligospora]
MHMLLKTTFLVAYILSCARADPIAKPEPVRYGPVTPSCTTNWYEAFVTDTTNQRPPVYLQVRASNPEIDGRNVVLRPDDKVRGTQRAVIDGSLKSPTLAIQMRKGILYSVGRDFSNNLFDLGPVGGFRNITYNAATLTGMAEFIFQNLTRKSKPDFRRSHKLFELIGGGDVAEYGLYWKTPNLVTNGFIACKRRDSKGGYWQMIYYVNGGSTTEDPKNCEYIGLNVILAPPLTMN